MGFETLIGPAVSLIGGAMGSDAASEAAAGQAQATRETNALTKQMFDKNVELQQPAIDAGNLARNRLLQVMGLGSRAVAPTREQFMRGGSPQPAVSSVGQIYRDVLGRDADAEGEAYWTSKLNSGLTLDDIKAQIAATPEGQGAHGAYQPASGSVFDEAAYNQAMQDFQASEAAAPFGSLMRNFSMADYQEDPGYQFRLSEGEKGINRSLASRGNFLSGAGLKALNAYNSGQASQEYGNAFNRYETNRTGNYNRYAGIAGSGQTAATTLGNTGANYATSVGNNLTNNANAQGAAGIAGANSWTNALSSGLNNYQQNNFMNSLLNNIGKGTGYGGGFGTGSKYGNQDYGQYF